MGNTCGAASDYKVLTAKEPKSHLKDGVYLFENGDTWTGKLNAEGRPGGFGVLSFKDGSPSENVYYYNGYEYYRGEWKDGHKHGKGIYYYQNGDMYDGDWENDQTSGIGIYYYKDDDRYEGQWKDGHKHGKGIYYYKDGGKYEGNWKNSQKHDRGILYYANGSKYEGCWAYGKQVGYGKYTATNAVDKVVSKFEGNFIDGLPNGQGLETIIREDGSIETCRGTWKNYKKNGFCRIEVQPVNGPSKLFYEGFYENNIPVMTYR